MPDIIIDSKKFTSTCKVLHKEFPELKLSDIQEKLSRAMGFRNLNGVQSFLNKPDQPTPCTAADREHALDLSDYARGDLLNLLNCCLNVGGETSHGTQWVQRAKEMMCIVVAIADQLSKLAIDPPRLLIDPSAELRGKLSTSKLKTLLQQGALFCMHTAYRDHPDPQIQAIAALCQKYLEVLPGVIITQTDEGVRFGNSPMSRDQHAYLSGQMIPWLNLLAVAERTPIRLFDPRWTQSGSPEYASWDSSPIQCKVQSFLFRSDPKQEDYREKEMEVAGILRQGWLDAEWFRYAAPMLRSNATIYWTDVIDVLTDTFDMKKQIGMFGDAMEVLQRASKVNEIAQRLDKLTA